MTAAIGEAHLFSLVQEGSGAVEEGVEDVDEDQIGEADEDLVAAGLFDCVIVVCNRGKNTVDDLDAVGFLVGGIAYLGNLTQVCADHLAHAEVLEVPVLGKIGVDSVSDFIVCELKLLSGLYPYGIELFELFAFKSGKLKQFAINVSSHYFASFMLSTKLSSLVVSGAIASREYS